MEFREWLLTEAAKPKLKEKLIGKYGKYKVFYVNGDLVRNMSHKMEEFGSSSNHHFLSDIPENEIWIEDNVKKTELPFIISTELYCLKKIGLGVEKWKAYHEAEKHSKSERERVEHIHASQTNKPGDPSVYISKYGHIEDEDITVWLVDGEKVRDRYKTDALEGMHGYVYLWVPNNEIWLESGIHSVEYPLILLHEYVERIIMKYKHVKYNKAHTIAAKVEFSKRPNKISKKEALSLTKDKALVLAKSYL